MEKKEKQESVSDDMAYPKYCTPVGIATEEQVSIVHPKGVRRVVGIDLSK
jgi:hypothetical protein